MSLVIPLQDEEGSVGALLESITHQGRCPDEVVVVDAGSRDRTAEIIRSFRGPFPVVILTRQRLYPGEARNNGVKAAANDWIAFADGGTTLRADWLQELTAVMDEQACDVVFGSYDPICDSSFKRCAAIAYVPPLVPGRGRGPFVASMLIRRSAFEAMGGFPPYRAAEDLVLIEKLLTSGLRVAYATNAVVDWHIAPDAASTFRRFALYSRHNLIAGRARYWHLGLAQQYAAVGVAVSIAAVVGLGTLSVLGIPAWLVARVVRAAWTKRRSFPFSTLNPLRVLGAATVLVLLDAATFAGTAAWLTSAGRKAH